MIFFRFIIISIFFLFLQNAVSQAEEKSKVLVEEEPLPLNDPFAGDSSSASTLVTEQEPTTDAVKLRLYKLVASFSGQHQSFITLVDDSGEFMTLELFEELTEGLMLVELDIKEAIFQKNDNSYISINFNNQIREKNE